MVTMRQSQLVRMLHVAGCQRKWPVFFSLVLRKASCQEINGYFPLITPLNAESSLALFTKSCKTMFCSCLSTSTETDKTVREWRFWLESSGYLWNGDVVLCSLRWKSCAPKAGVAFQWRSCSWKGLRKWSWRVCSLAKQDGAWSSYSYEMLWAHLASVSLSVAHCVWRACHFSTHLFCYHRSCRAGFQWWWDRKPKALCQIMKKVAKQDCLSWAYLPYLAYASYAGMSP